MSDTEEKEVQQVKYVYNQEGTPLTPPWYKIPDEDKPFFKMSKVSHMTEYEKLCYGEEHGCHTIEVKEKFAPYRTGVACRYLKSGSEYVIDPLLKPEQAIGVGVWLGENEEDWKKEIQSRAKKYQYTLDDYGFALLTPEEFNHNLIVERMITM